MMKTSLLAGAAAIALMSTSAMAQTTAPKGPASSTTPRSITECQGDFTKADRNKDGRLDKTEMTSLGGALPTSLASATSTSQSEFMQACGGTSSTTGSAGGNAGGPGPMPGKTGGSITK